MARVCGARGSSIATGASADALGQGHDDPFRSAHVGHAPDVLVLADAADHFVAVHREPVDGGLEVVNLESDVAQPQLLAVGAGDPGRWPDRSKLASSSRVLPSGVRSMTISVQASGMPMTVSRNSPSMNAGVPSTSRPSLNA